LPELLHEVIHLAGGVNGEAVGAGRSFFGGRFAENFKNVHLGWNKLVYVQLWPHFQNRFHDAIGVIFAGE
jgi:hypothetical protein